MYGLLFILLFQITYLDARTDPEVNFNVPQMIEYWGYPAEEHKVQTLDGYILKIHRIPHGKNEKYSSSNKPVVFLQHGLLCSSSNWVSNLPSESLGYLLADAGFDVWLGNVRGNTYGLEHVTLKPDQTEFWDFSWDKMALYDLPAMIDYVLNTTKMASLGYIGHSQGTMMAFAGLSLYKELAGKVNVLIALGPVATVGNITSPIRYLAPFSKDVEFLCKFIGACGFDFLPSDAFMKFLATFLCGHKEFEDIICENVMFLLCGYDAAQLNKTRLPVYISHTPAGTSVKNIIHYGQMVESGKFQRFNYYNKKDNLDHYNMTEPPVFNVSHVSVPTVLYYGEHDWLADPRDVASLAKALPNVIYSQEIPKWEHLDFIWGLDASRLVYKPLLKYLNEYAMLEIMA
ncbi:lysosomal acid lipase/cholesteryl ester hydrolase-like [Dendronephthya gigantea]|uniref:lysosomal acid lipase/cholesteryl ester hydrolase-like n=1 Tax=Dendronephthya gigantea TaxID=151771 RepID=UPI00106A1D9C|nr:lysosomal acid lipase/cholesteryl ester hydrolase-like [Dendronephthya gigantea]